MGAIRRVLRIGLLWFGVSGAVLVAGPASASVAANSNGLIAFMRGDAVWVMHPDGSAQTRLTKMVDPAWTGTPAFSPDGRRIAYTCGNFEICVMNADGSHPIRLTSNAWPARPVVDLVPTWSPDGTRIAFARLENGREDLYAVDLDGGGLRQLTYGTFDEDPAWSPDGARIAFDGFDRLGLQQVFVINADGGDRRQVTAGVSADSQSPAWSPDGQRLAYMRTPLAMGLAIGVTQLWVANVDGTGTYALTSGPWSQSDPAWSPDGRLIAYDSNEGHALNIWAMNADGTGQIELTHGGGYKVTPTWQPVPSPPPVAPLPAASTRPPSRPIPEARLAAIFFNGVELLYREAGGVSNIPAVARTIGTRLINDAATLRRPTLATAPKTKWGRTFKRGALAMYAMARAAGDKFNAAVADALKGRADLARRDTTAAFGHMVRMFDDEALLMTVL